MNSIRIEGIQKNLYTFSKELCRNGTRLEIDTNSIENEEFRYR